MNAENENVLSMAQTVQAFYTDNQGELDAALPAITAQMAELDSRVDAIMANATQANIDITGFAQQKQLLEESLIKMTFKVGNACASYHTVAAPDEGTKESVDWTKSELQGMRDNDLYMAGSGTLEIAQPLSGMLDPYGVTATDISDLESALATYKAYIQTPQKKISKRESLNKQQDQMVSDLRKFFKDVLDQLMEPLAIDHTLLYDNYKAARNIIDLPGGGGSEPYVAMGELMAAAKLNIPLPSPQVKLFPSTLIKLGNTGEQAGLHLRFYFHNAPSGPENTATAYKDVMAGNQAIVAAADLGYNSTTGWVYLIVSNATNGDQSYRVEV